jgi:hypothetical protein
MAVNISEANLLTVITVYADYHKQIVERAEASVSAQTIPTTFLCYPDHTGSPARGRNKGAGEATTPFITFLDADDTLARDYAEKMILAYHRGRYVYCDYMEGDQRHVMPEAHDCRGYKIHLVTCLWGREVFKQTGGFKENALMEDTEFYLRVMSNGICGIRCPYPLVNYNAGARSQQAKSDPRYQTTLTEYYRSNPIMACCGKGQNVQPATPANEPQEGDVLVQSLWGGMLLVVGQQTGRRYFTGNGRKLWVAPEDAAAMPNKFKMVQPDIQDPVDFDAVKNDVLSMLRAGA